MSTICSNNCRPFLIPNQFSSNSIGGGSHKLGWKSKLYNFGVRSCSLESSFDSNSPNQLRKMERAWLISQQPRPIACSSCDSNGHVECKWCGGTGFFILGDKMLCEVSSKNTSCIICAGKGSACCSDCKGTGFRAKWLE